MSAIHLNPWTPLLAFGIPSIALVAFLMWKNGRAMMKLDEKIDHIGHATNGQLDGERPLVMKVEAIGAEQLRVRDEHAEETRQATQAAADIEGKADELLEHDAERDKPGARYGDKSGPVD